MPHVVVGCTRANPNGRRKRSRKPSPCNESGPDRIETNDKNDRNGRRRCLRGQRCRWCSGCNDTNIPTHEFSRHFW